MCKPSAATDDRSFRGISQEYYRRIEAKMAEEELGIRGKREPPKLTTPYITKTDSYTPGSLYHFYTVVILQLDALVFLNLCVSSGFGHSCVIFLL